MPAHTIVAIIRSDANHVERVKAELTKLVSSSRQDPGCLQYDLHQDTTDPTRFLFFENWESRELWKRHMETPHLQTYRANTEGVIDEFSLHEMTKIA